MSQREQDMGVTPWAERIRQAWQRLHGGDPASLADIPPALLAPVPGAFERFDEAIRAHIEQCDDSPRPSLFEQFKKDAK